jgi:hypothetical protein
LGRDVAGGFRIDRDVALIVQSQIASERRREMKTSRQYEGGPDAVNLE